MNLQLNDLAHVLHRPVEFAFRSSYSEAVIRRLRASINARFRVDGVSVDFL